MGVAIEPIAATVIEPCRLITNYRAKLINSLLNNVLYFIFASAVPNFGIFRINKLQSYFVSSKKRCITPTVIPSCSDVAAVTGIRVAIRC